jgi:hypothetical protein
MSIVALLGFGVAVSREAKKMVIRNVIRKAKIKRLVLEDLNCVEMKIPAKVIKTLLLLQQDHQCELLNILLMFMDEAMIEEGYFMRFLVTNASHELLQQVCYMQIESPY